MPITAHQPSPAVRQEVDSWIGIADNVVIRRTDAFGTEIAITHDRDGYTVIRGFRLGDGAGVSVDLQDATAAEVFKYLLERQ